MKHSTAIIAITRTGVSLALQLQGKLPGSDCYVPERHQFALAMGAKGFDRLRSIFPRVWSAYDGLICIMATGIVVRQITPLIRHKAEDPAVVVLDEKGQFVISLLSGHLGGANRLAREVAGHTGGQPVITTATDVQGMPALDLIAREAGLEIENLRMLSRVSRAILEDEPIRVHDPEGRLRPFLPTEMVEAGRVVFVSWSGTMADRMASKERAPARPGNGADSMVDMGGDSGYWAFRLPAVDVWVSERYAPPGLECLELRPPKLVVGIGCNRGTPAGEILDLLRGVFDQERLSIHSIRNFASIDLKADEAGLMEAAGEIGRPVEFFPRERIEAVAVPNPSEMVAAHIGVPSVCEATALISAGSSSTLIVPKRKSKNATLAVAGVGFP